MRALMIRSFEPRTTWTTSSTAACQVQCVQPTESASGARDYSHAVGEVNHGVLLSKRNRRPDLIDRRWNRTLRWNRYLVNKLLRFGGRAWQTTLLATGCQSWAIVKQANPNVKVVVDDTWPKNKPRALNVAVPHCSGTIIGVFDSVASGATAW